MQDPEEVPEDEYEDGSPETDQDVDDPDNEEEDNCSMFNFNEEPHENEDVSYPKIHPIPIQFSSDP